MGPYRRARKVSGSGSFRSWSGEAAHSVQSWAVSWNPVALRLLLAPGAGVLRFGGASPAGPVDSTVLFGYHYVLVYHFAPFLTILKVRITFCSS